MVVFQSVYDDNGNDDRDVARNALMHAKEKTSKGVE